VPNKSRLRHSNRLFITFSFRHCIYKYETKYETRSRNTSATLIRAASRGRVGTAAPQRPRVEEVHVQNRAFRARPNRPAVRIQTPVARETIRYSFRLGARVVSRLGCFQKPSISRGNDEPVRTVIKIVRPSDRPQTNRTPNVANPLPTRLRFVVRPRWRRFGLFWVSAKSADLQNARRPFRRGFPKFKPNAKHIGA